MREVDETRDRLKLDDIEEGDRKNLFNKFVDAGGEVLTDRKKTTQNLANNLRKNVFVNNTPNFSDSKSKRETSRQAASKTSQKTKNSKVAVKVKKEVSPFYNIKLWFDAFTSGVITFFGGKIHPKFLNFIDKNVVSALLEMDTLIFNALNPIGINDIDSKNKREQVINKFAGDFEDLELLERIRNQYNEKIYKNLLRQYKELNSSVIASSYVNELKNMFKPLYILHIYTSRIKLTGERAMIAFSIVDNMSKAIANSRISAFKRATDLIYSRYYPKLLILLQYASKEKLETIEDFNRYLEIKDEDILGYYAKLKLANQKLNENKIEEAKENIGKKDDEEEKLNKIESIGAKLIEKCVSFKKEDNNIEYETDPFYTVDENDKIYRIKILIDFLDREYSILFVSNKVKYNSVFDNLVRTDYKADFNNIFLSLSDINSRFNEYNEICRGILKVEQDEGMRFEQRVAMLSERNGQRAYIAKNLKSTVESIISSFKRKLDKLLLDKEEREKIIANPNDILTFFTDVGNGKKRVQGYNVLKALTEAYYFVSGFYYLINEGKLSGTSLLIDGADSGNNIKVNKETKDAKKEENIKNDNAADVNNINNNEKEKNEENKNNQNEEGVDNDTAFLNDIEIDEDATDIK